MTDFSTIASTALGTGLATAAFNQGISLWTERSREKVSARYLAVRLAIILEKFALDCADRVGDAETHVRTFKLPELAPFPDEDSWKALDAEFLEKALSLQHEVTLSRQLIAFEFELDPNPDGSEFSNQCGKCGFMAWTLAIRLRQRYRLPTFDPSITGWDIVEHLRTRYEKVLAEAKTRL